MSYSAYLPLRMGQMYLAVIPVYLHVVPGMGEVYLDVVPGMGEVYLDVVPGMGEVYLPLIPLIVVPGDH